jgi:hypothetical protein
MRSLATDVAKANAEVPVARRGRRSIDASRRMD